MSERRKKILGFAFPLAFLLVVMVLAGAYYLFFHGPFGVTDAVSVYIDRDDNADSIRAKVVEAGCPSQMLGFDILARYDHLDQRIRTGHYVIQASDNWRRLVRRFVIGNQSPVKLRVNGVRTIGHLARQLGAQLMIDSVEIASVLCDTAFLATLGYDVYTLPAMFIPDTYEVNWNIDARRLMMRLQKEHDRFWTAQRRQQAAAVGLTDVEVATLASIVDEETAADQEKPMVAGLYLNRLHAGMLLQADPTVKFAVGDFMLRRILNKHLDVESPYNTYLHAGLPPGPIRIASIKGMESVLNPVHHSYLYMCAKEDFSGTHNFSESLAGHLQNARRYQDALNQRGIK